MGRERGVCMRYTLTDIESPGGHWNSAQECAEQ